MLDSLRNLLIGSSPAGNPIPFDRVPPEILAEIVAFFSGSRDTWDGRKELANLAKRDLLLLAQVCAHWHTMIMHTPALWGSVEVNARFWPWRSQGFSSFGKAYYKYLGILEMALWRAKGTPLRVVLNVDGAKEDVVEAIVGLLGRHSQQWEQLTLKKLPLLRSLSLSVYGTSDGIEACNVFEDAPSLRHVRLDVQSMPKLPWAQLRSCTYQDSGTTGFLRVVNHLSSNATFTFHHVAHLWATLPVPLPTTHKAVVSNVSTLDIDLTAAAITPQLTFFLAAIFDCLVLPRLHALRILRTSGFPLLSWPTDTFVRLAEGSGLRLCLCTLDLRSVKISQRDLERTLEVLDALEDLAVADFPEPGEWVLLEDGLFDRLTALVPRLTHLRCTTLFRFSAESLAAFVSSRTTFKSFRLTLRAPPKAKGVYAAADAVVHSPVLVRLVAEGRLTLDNDYDSQRQHEHELKEHVNTRSPPSPMGRQDMYLGYVRASRLGRPVSASASINAKNMADAERWRIQRDVGKGNGRASCGLGIVQPENESARESRVAQPSSFKLITGKLRLDEPTTIGKTRARTRRTCFKNLPNDRAASALATRIRRGEAVKVPCTPAA
ncbi:hypothetical protein C8F01DRAFT_1271502 [Mycena amicta]|nr:hypothetical protein C8F01DRAFT_1271502 [Mycena amicta]